MKDPNAPKRILRRDRVFVLEYSSTFDGVAAHITHATARRVSDGKTYELPAAAGGIAEFFNNNGAVYVWVWDISFFGGFLLHYALSSGLPAFENARKRKGGHGAAEPCYSALYGAAHGCLNFRLTLRRTAKTHDYGSGNMGGLHTVEYRGIAPFFQHRPREEIEKHCGGGDLLAIYNDFIRAYSDLSGEEVETFAYLRKVYTIGGAARRRYLRERYGKTTLSPYHKEHPQDEECDDYFRARRLVLSGMCFFPTRNKGAPVRKRLFKYDVNSLYSATANCAGDLTYPRESNFDEFMRDRTPNAVYIIVLRDFVAYRKREMPNCFANPFNSDGGDIIQIKQQFAMFRELYFALHDYYNFEEFEVMRVFKMERFDDPAMIRYNDFFASRKIAADVAGDGVGRMVAKLFMNNIIGKMIQNTKYVPIIPTYEPRENLVKFARGAVVDNWEKGHFHLVRGAYIYTLARVRMMNDIRELLRLTDFPAEHHYYTDTDSIITDVEMPSEWIDAEAVGKYKVECKYDFFAAFAKKVYFGHTVEGENTLTAAGIKKGTVLEQISAAYGDLSAEEVFGVLSMPLKYVTRVQTQVCGGCAYVEMLVRIQDIDVEKGEF